MSSENHDLLEGEFVKYVNKLDYPVNISDFLKIELPKPSVKDLSGNLMIKDKNEYKLPEEKSLKGFGAVSVKKNSRQNIIISILKRKREVMIKDVSPLIEG